MKKFVTIFPDFMNFHSYKDPGQIPFRFKEKGWDAKIICYKHEKSYESTQKYVPINIIPNLRFNFGLIWYLLKTARKIDVLNVYHIQWTSLFLAFIYKLLNPKGFAYLKMDNCNYCGPYPWEALFERSNRTTANLQLKKLSLKDSYKNKLIPKLAKSIDLWSIEDQASCEHYENKYSFLKNKIITIFNGHTIDIYSKNLEVLDFKNKKDIILTVSNLGTYSKATAMLLDSYITVAKQTSWNLHLAGSVAKDFEPIIKKYFNENPELESRVIFHGPLDKIALFELYNQSKIFCLPSRFEGFANVYPEAMYFRNAIVTTPTTSVKDLISENQLGELVEVDNAEQLSETLLKLINNPLLNERYANNAKIFCENNLSWDTITDKLQLEIERRRILKINGNFSKEFSN